MGLPWPLQNWAWGFARAFVLPLSQDLWLSLPRMDLRKGDRASVRSWELRELTRSRHRLDATGACWQTISYAPCQVWVQIAADARDTESAKRQVRVPEEATFSTDSGDAGVSEKAKRAQPQIWSQKRTWRSERDQISAFFQVKPNWGKRLRSKAQGACCSLSWVILN